MSPEYDEFGRPLRQFIPPVPMQPAAPNYGAAGIIPPQRQLPQLQEPPTAINPALVASSNLQNIQPTVQQPQQSQQPQQQMPDFSPVAPQPATTRLESTALPPDPRDPQFKNSRLMTVLNAIAGGFAGAAGHPEIGGQLHDANFNRALGTYNRNLDVTKLQSGSEQKRTEEGVKRGSAQSLAISREVKAGQEERKLTLKEKDDQSKAKHREELGKYIEYKMAHPELTEHELPYLMSLSEEDAPAALTMLKKLQEMKQTNTPEQAVARQTALNKNTVEDPNAAAAARIKNQAAATGHAVGTGTPEALAAAKAAAAARAEGSKSVADHLNSTQRKAVDNALETANARPDTFYDVQKSLPTPAEKGAFIAEFKGIPPKKLNNEEQKISDNARTAIGHVENIANLLSDPEIQAKSLGPLKGRITELYQSLGTSFRDGKPVPSEITAKIDALDLTRGLTIGGKEAELLNSLKYLILFEASATSGTRPSWQLIKYLSETAGTKFDVSKMMGNLSAAVKSAHVRLAGLYQDTSKGLPVQDKNKTPAGHVRLPE